MHDTKEKIINSATDIFVKKGFSGTSMSMIAKAAKVNQSLIYHHFESKEELWESVRDTLIVKSDYAYVNREYNSFEEFIDDIIANRVALFRKDRRIVRFMQWQRLEDEKSLVGGKVAYASKWIKVILDLQKAGKVKDNYEPEIIYTYIAVLTTDYLDDSCHFFRDNLKREDEYIKMIRNEIIKTFSTE